MRAARTRVYQHPEVQCLARPQAWQGRTIVLRIRTPSAIDDEYRRCGANCVCSSLRLMFYGDRFPNVGFRLSVELPADAAVDV
jgi:hypothetical protein